MDFINQIAKEHSRWIKYVNSFGEYCYAEDIVQEMYIKLYEAEQREFNPNDGRFRNKLKMSKRVINEDGSINLRYIFLTLYSMFSDYSKQKGRVIKVDVSELNLKNDTDLGDFEYEKIIKKLDSIKDGWHWYYKMLFDLYSKTDMSLRDISNETKIGLRAVWEDIEKCKDSIRENLFEDYQDYKNEDYELI